eukprot:SAG22_NODE_5748_length_960_cov_17.099884_1_plen_200_part_01
MRAEALSQFANATSGGVSDPAGAQLYVAPAAFICSCTLPNVFRHFAANAVMVTHPSEDGCAKQHRGAGRAGASASPGWSDCRRSRFAAIAGDTTGCGDTASAPTPLIPGATTQRRRSTWCWCLNATNRQTTDRQAQQTGRQAGRQADRQTGGKERHCLRETVLAEAHQKDSALLLRTGLGEHRVGKDGGAAASRRRQPPP